MSDRALPPGESPELVVTIGGADPRVSWNHAVLRADGDVWLVEDCGSRNGTFAEEDRVDRFQLGVGCTVRLGSAADGPALICSALPPPPLPGSTYHPTRMELRPTLRPPLPAPAIGPATSRPVGDGRPGRDIRAGRLVVADPDQSRLDPVPMSMREIPEAVWQPWLGREGH